MKWLIFTAWNWEITRWNLERILKKLFRQSTLLRLNDELLQCEMKRWDRVEQLFHNYMFQHEERQYGDADFFHSLASIICSIKDEHVYVKMEAADGEIYTVKKRRVLPQQLCLTTMVVKSLKLALKLSPAEPSQLVITWRWYQPKIFFLRTRIFEIRISIYLVIEYILQL